MNVLIIGGSPQAPTPSLLSQLFAQSDIQIAVDSGANCCINSDLTPTHFIGDADSVSSKAFLALQNTSCTMSLFNPEKDQTDLYLALDLCKSLSTTQLTITGITGGRVDHQLAVFGTLAAFKQLQPHIVEDCYEAYILSPDGRHKLQLTKSEHIDKTVSCIALAANTCISESGMKWPVDHFDLPILSDRGVSNLIENDYAHITVHQGVLLVTISN